MNNGAAGRPRPEDDLSRQIIEEKIVKISGEIALRRYQRGKFLGKGGFARVYEFKNLET